ncbi:solute carrier family 49 member 4 homolog isoform X2 [Oratosquilla oratoria]
MMTSAEMDEAEVVIDHDDTVPLHRDVEVQVYKRRWWILFVFAGLGFMQCAVWNTWGPITSSAKTAYSWDNAEIARLSMWGTVTMIVGLIPFTILLQRKGLRVAMIVTSFFMALGTLIRCFSQDEEVFTILANIAAILNGLSGIIICTAPSLLSSTWFPPKERTTATGVGCTFNQLGNAGGFFLGPLIVKSPNNSSKNGTDPNATLFLMGDEPDPAEVDVLRKEIMDYMWITAGICVAFFIFTIAYFPSKPKKPPSLSANLHEETRPLLADLKLISKNCNFWTLLIPYAVTIGLNVAWSSVLDINVMPFNISQDEAGWLGVYVTFGSVAMALIAARFTDILFGHIKLTIIILMGIATTGFTWFLLLMNRCLPFSKVQMYISVIIGASFNYACSPLFFELAVEIAYPVSEGVVGGFLTLFWNIAGSCFLFSMQGIKEDVVWMDYVLAVQGMLVIVLVAFVKEEYKRTQLDRPIEGESDEVSDEDRTT